ncbi:MAG: hypothetical protein R3C09_17825 [Pirellulaceae bacterium]
MPKYASKRNQLTGQWKSMAKRSALSVAILATAPSWTSPLPAQDDSSALAHVQTAQFKIPFNVDARGREDLQVQLWVSADDGSTWQTFGSVPADKKSFEFRAAAEGVYLFKVATIDAAGTSFPNPGPPLRVLVDTTKPHSEIRADVNAMGQLVVEVRVVDEHLDTNTAVLRIRSDHETRWRDLAIELHSSEDGVYRGQVVADLAPCREVAVVFAIKDRSLNESEATCQYSMPRTASAPHDMTLASTNGGGGSDVTSRTLTRPQLTSTPGATRWNPTPTNSNASNKPSPGRLVADSGLSLEPFGSSVGSSSNRGGNNDTEELPLPAALDSGAQPANELQPADLGEAPTSVQNRNPGQAPQFTSSQPNALESSLDGLATEPQTRTDNRPSGNDHPSDLNASSPATTIGRAFHCKSRAFSLDYSVEALGGSALADVELWGTEDGGREWQKWGSDPDRTSPFDVQVGNDGLFGFRMVIVGANGVVSNRPREGDSADVWINVDTVSPATKITRAVYGEGPEDGLLVIDYQCEDVHLVDRPIALSFSDRVDGPWTSIATGLANTGIYLWKADPSLPDKIFLKLECIDKAGNIGTHRLDLPIDVRGLAPRGIIQGFRPIEMPAK